MTLATLITQHAASEAAESNWFAVAAILNAPTVAVRNEKSWTMDDLITLVGAQAAAFIGGTIKAAGETNPIFDGAWIALNVTGLQLHTDERQAMIDGLASAGNWSPELTAAVKAAGVTYTSLAGEDVTAEQCQAAWTAHQRSELLVSLQQQFDAIKNQIGTSEQADAVTALRAMADALEAV